QQENQIGPMRPRFLVSRSEFSHDDAPLIQKARAHLATSPDEKVLQRFPKYSQRSVIDGKSPRRHTPEKSFHAKSWREQTQRDASALGAAPCYKAKKRRIQEPWRCPRIQH